jgi:acyl carrier protein
MNTRAQILAGVAQAIRDVIGEDWIADEAIEESTSFADDLELESIEFVALAEKLQEIYGERVDFVRWLSQMELDAIIGLTVGDVVEFIESCLS